MPPTAGPRRPVARRNITTSSEAPADPTPTPGSSRPPVHRLQSLNRRAPTGSIPAARTPGPGGEPAKPTLKYKPRAVGRRSKEERDAIEKVEAERHRERLAEAAAKQRGRGGTGPRGRGGLARGGRIGGADGPLGSGSGPRRGRGGKFGGASDSRAASGSRSRTRSVIGISGPRGAGRDASSDESDDEVRVSIDQINLESDDEEEFDGKVPDKKGKMPYQPKREKGLRPVRVEGHEHQERVVSVNMESSSSKSAALREQAQAQARTGQDNALFVEQMDGAQATENGPRIKEEPPDEDQTMTDAIPHADEVVSIDDGPLPEQQVKVRRKLTTEEPAVVGAPQAAEEPKADDPRRLLRTAEEIQEFERHEHDLGEMKNLFTAEEEKPKEPRPEPQPTTEGGEEQEAEKPEEEEQKDKLAGHLFLIQFPPMTPNLIAPSVEKPAETAGQAGPQAAENQTEPAIKQDGNGEVEVTQSGPQEPADMVTATNRQLQAGRVGKMNVHASGRVTLDWGGISFELGRSTPVDFLQEALIMTSPEAEEEAEERRVWSMGQLSGKFTVTPNWAEML